MRSLSAAIAATIDKDVMDLAFCWRVRREDGVTIGFTTHDRSLAIEGTIYHSAPGMQPSAVTTNNQIDDGGMDVTGALTHDLLRAEDIDTGRFDGAAIDFFAVSWSDPEAGRIDFASGRLGDVVRRRGGFEAELKTAAAQLAAIPVELCSPECRARLGDTRCRKDLRALTSIFEVVTVPDDSSLTVTPALIPGVYAYGRVRPLEGVYAGLDFEILQSDTAMVTLRNALPGAFSAGMKVELREGCDRRFSTCRDRFQNQLNFRGEPHVPGADSVMRYPGI